MITFRWSVWEDNDHLRQMLSHSIGTFQHFFGGSAEYLVVTDNPSGVRKHLKANAKVLDVRKAQPCNFDDQACTWRKWWPGCRINPENIEFRVDADMFLLEEPTEIWEFCQERFANWFLCTTEWFKADWLYGHFATLLSPDLPQVNAGLIGQHKGADLSESFMRQYEWWRANVPPSDVKYHDEQGAVARALETHLLDGRVMLLPSDRYRVVCPLNDPPVESTKGIVLLHATYPDHPAFYKFLQGISTVSGIPVG